MSVLPTVNGVVPSLVATSNNSKPPAKPKAPGFFSGIGPSISTIVIGALTTTVAFLWADLVTSGINRFFPPEGQEDVEDNFVQKLLTVLALTVIVTVITIVLTKVNSKK